MLTYCQYVGNSIGSGPTLLMLAWIINTWLNYKYMFWHINCKSKEKIIDTA